MFYGGLQVSATAEFVSALCEQKPTCFSWGNCGVFLDMSLETH